MLYNKKKGWAFVHVPNNAGTSVENSARKMDHEDHEWLIKGGQTHHNKWSYWSQFDEVKDLQPVGLLRNPWDRCLSMFTYNIDNCAKNLDTAWGRVGHGRLLREGLTSSWAPAGFFVDSHDAEAEFNEETGRQWAQQDEQNSWLPETNPMWFRIEDQMEEFCEYTGIEMPEVDNTSTRGKYQDYYSNESQFFIHALFQRDILLGGYKFE